MPLIGTAPRRVAIYLLDQVLGQQRLLSDCLATAALEALSPSERARAQRLATETLRGLERADRVLADHLQKPPALTVRNTLRLGTVELCQGEVAHGVVNAMVQITADHHRFRNMRGLVNAVLRLVAAHGPEKWARLRAPRMPKWLRTRLNEAWGWDAVQAIEAAHFAGAPLDLTPRSDRIPGVKCATMLPTGSLRLPAGSRVSALPGYDTGQWWVQDAAAAIAAKALAVTAGERVLDLCAAPGGKTLQLAAAGADVTAVDASGPRLAVLHKNLARTKLRANVQEADIFDVSGQFDAILLDAPCSGTGTIRRHPDLPHVRDGSGLPELTRLQERMLEHAWTLLKPGGRMVYCTCSLLPVEGEVQILTATRRHADMQVNPGALAVPGIAPDWIAPKIGLRLRPDFWPEHGGMDGFFIAALRKTR